MSQSFKCMNKPTSSRRNITALGITIVETVHNSLGTTSITFKAFAFNSFTKAFSKYLSNIHGRDSIIITFTSTPINAFTFTEFEHPFIWIDIAMFEIEFATV